MTRLWRTMCPPLQRKFFMIRWTKWPTLWMSVILLPNHPHVCSLGPTNKEKWCNSSCNKVNLLSPAHHFCWVPKFANCNQIWVSGILTYPRRTSHLCVIRFLLSCKEKYFVLLNYNLPPFSTIHWLIECLIYHHDFTCNIVSHLGNCFIVKEIM